MWQSLAGNDCVVDGAATISCFPIIIGNVIYWLLILAGIVALAFIILSGFKFLTSGGDPKQAEGARKTLTYAVIGLVLVLLSFGIVRVIGQVTGVRENCITRFGFTQCVPGDIKNACSARYPDGWCDDKNKECLPSSDQRFYTCRFRCSDKHHNGWCSGAKTCKRFVHAGDVTWTCQN